MVTGNTDFGIGFASRESYRLSFYRRLLKGCLAKRGFALTRGHSKTAGVVTNVPTCAKMEAVIF